MSEKKQYRAVVGFVQFEPRENEVGGKKVRNISVRQTGFGQFAPRVSATLWPSHAHVKVEEGDLVAIEGAYTANSKTTDDGEKITYHNLSVSKIVVLGAADSGKQVETVNAGSDDDAGDEDLPF